MKFKDSHGKAWEVELTFGAMLRVKQGTAGKYNLLEPETIISGEKSLAETLRDDYGEFYEVLWHLFAPQCEAGGYPDPAQFADAIPSKQMAALHDQFADEWQDFFHGLNRPEKAEAIRAVWAFQRAAAKLIQEKLNSPEYRRLETLASAKIDQALNNYFGSLEEQLGSTPARSPGDNST